MTSANIRVVLAYLRKQMEKHNEANRQAVLTRSGDYILEEVFVYMGDGGENEDLVLITNPTFKEFEDSIGKLPHAVVLASHKALWLNTEIRVTGETSELLVLEDKKYGQRQYLDPSRIASITVGTRKIAMGGL